MEPLDRAAEALGSQRALAELLGVSNGAVSQWKTPGRRIPAEYCPVIERATKDRGKPVMCEELRPDMDWAILRLQAAPADTP